ncbi:MAG: hypothetical protein LQ349_005358 [Xanthoria aureola]|nr:MAG: hypothetical protein LQ349_005358 [Xanthoria aureola]
MLIASFRYAGRANRLGRFSTCHHHEASRASLTTPSLEASRLLQTQASADTVPFRKQLKDEARQRKHVARGTASNESASDDAKLAAWELTVGLEIHAQLNTERKLFSGASTSASEQPNNHVAFFDFALPGAQPQLQKATVLPAIRAALALGCQVQTRSQFDRKHYFYADQPAGYQITQYYQPFATGGKIILNDFDGIAADDGKSVVIGIQQVQLEQDTAKTVLQPPSEAMLDFNRVSHPLIEIITLPQIHQAQTAAACVKKIQALLQAVNAVTAGMELGGLRVDVNVSVRRRNQNALGQRTEIKNLSSIKAVEDAIIAERNRQISVLESGGAIQGETRGWTLGASDTVKLRGKEGEVDYRYMPDPDLGPLLISNELVTKVAEALPQFPDQIAEELVECHGLTIKDAKTLVELDGGMRLDYFDSVRSELAAFHSQIEGNPVTKAIDEKELGVTIANWVLHEMGGLLSTSESAFSADRVPAKELAFIILMLSMGRITGRTAKQLLAKKFHGDTREIQTIIRDENLGLVHLSEEEYVSMARELLDGHPAIVAQIKDKGQIGKLGFFMGQMMRRGEGKVVAQRAEATLKKLLGLTQ